MPTPIRFPWRRATVALVLTMPIPAWAGNVDYVPVEDDESAIVDDLGDTFSRYAYSVDRWLKVEAPNAPEITLGRTFSSFESGFRKATVARLEYTYEKYGRTETVTYHAMSGTEPDEAFTRLLTGINRAPVTPLSPTAEQFERNHLNVRSVSIDDADSDIHPIETADGLNHSADAELKALRNLERDLKLNKVSEHGRLIARVSKMPCQSCRTVFDQFTDLHPMPVEVAYPVEQSDAYRAFDTYRKTAFRVVRNNRATTEPVRTMNAFEEAIRRSPCH